MIRMFGLSAAEDVGAIMSATTSRISPGRMDLDEFVMDIMMAKLLIWVARILTLEYSA
jgi:hypothetical protein